MELQQKCSHIFDYTSDRASALVDFGTGNHLSVRKVDEDRIDGNPAVQDGAAILAILGEDCVSFVIAAVSLRKSQKSSVRST